MTISVAQTKQGIGSGNSLALSFTSTPPVGSLIVVCVAAYAGDLGTTAVTDNQGNTYTRRQYLSAASSVYLAIYSAIAATSSGTFTVTANPTGTSADIAMTLLAVSGASATPFDQSINGSGNGTAVSSGNVTPSEANELLVAAMTHLGSDRTLTEEAGWTLAGENEGGTSNQPISSVYKVQTTATTEDADWTIGTGAVDWLACVVTFKAASGGTVYTQSLSGSLTPAGAISKQTTKLATGSISPAGSAIKQTVKQLAGGLSPSGALSTLRAILVSLSGSISPIGGLSKQAGKTFSGAITAAGSLVKQTGKLFTGSISPAGTVSALKSMAQVVLNGVLSFSGDLSKRTDKVLSGTVTLQGGLIKQTQKILGGILNLVGSLTTWASTPPTKQVILTLLPRSQTLSLSARSLNLTVNARSTLLPLGDRSIAFSLYPRSTGLSLEER